MLTSLTFMPALIRYFPSLLTYWLVMCNVHKEEETKVQQTGFEGILLLITVEK